MKLGRILLGWTLALLWSLSGAAWAQVVTEFSNGIRAGAFPLGITAGPDGNLWFTEGVGNRIGKITPSGVVTEYSSGITSAATTEPFLWGITTGPDGNLWFAEFGNGLIGKITTNGVVTEYGSGISAGARPVAITAGPDGNLWFTESLNRIGIGKITTDGVVTEYTSGISAGVQILYDITAGPDGNLWFTECNGGGGFNGIGKITTAGVVTEYSEGISAGACPVGITTGPDGNLWFAEVFGNRIGKITPEGVISHYSTGITADALPAYITAGPDGNLWFTENRGNRIGKITTDGVVTEYSSGISVGAQPFGITAGPDDNLWFAENRDRIGRITTGATCPLSGNVTLNFDDIAVSGCFNATSYLGGKGIAFSSPDAGAYPVICSGSASSAGIPTSGANWFAGGAGPGLGNAPLTYTLNFCAPVSNISLSAVAINTCCTFPPMTFTANNAQGPIVSQSLPGGFGSPATAVSLPGSGITLLTIHSDQTATTFTDRPIDDLSFTVGGGTPLSVTTSSLPSGTVGSPYSQSLAATGGTPPYTWFITSGALPDHLALAGSTIAGVPSVAGTFKFTVQVSDSMGNNATQPLSILIQPTPCTFVLSPTGQAFSAQGGLGSFTVNTGPACTWNLVPSVGWITIMPSGSKGTAKANFAVAANGGAARSGFIAVGGQHFNIDQQGFSCSYAINPSVAAFNDTGGSARVVVNAPAGCPWTATSNAGWITVTSGGSGSGNGAVVVDAAPNSGGARSGTVTIAGKVFTVTEGAGVCGALDVGLTRQCEGVGVHLFGARVWYR